MAIESTGKFRILAADTLAAEGLAFIQSQPDAQLSYKPGLSEQQLAAIVSEYDGMIVRSGAQVTAKVLENPGRLKAITRAGVGVDNIDLDAATAKGILVMNSAEASTISTAEHTFALMMALARNIGAAYLTVNQGGWDRGKFTGMQLSGKTLGIVGFGRIGQAVAQRALAFGMTVIAYDPFINAKTMMDGQVRIHGTLEAMLTYANILTFHVPLNDQTRAMLGAEQFAKCIKGVLVINTARGGVVDEQELLAALDTGQCGGAALDVFTLEPPDPHSPLRRHPKVLATPHLGASTREAQQAVSISAAQSLLAYLRGQSITGAVNAPGLRVDLDPIQACFVDLAHRMAQLINPMITQGIAQVTFELSGKELTPVAETVERSALVGLLREHLNTPVNIINVRHLAEQRGMALRTITVEGERHGSPELVIQVESNPVGSSASGQSRRIVGRVYNDLRPRVVEINGYHMDMIPEGVLVLIQNDDRPGMVGLVGAELGQANINIADMAISRRDGTALMLLKVDSAPTQEMLNRLQGRPGIRNVAMVTLPG